MNTKGKIKIILIGAIGLIVCVVCLSMYFMKPVKMLKQLLASANYSKAVEYFNKGKYSDSDYNELSMLLEEYLKDTRCDWNEESVSYNQAKELFSAFSEINDEKLASLAKENLKYITIEYEGDMIVEKAEAYYDKKEYLQSMKCVIDADKSYSQYPVLDSLYKECRSILIGKIGSPETVSEYETAISEYERYIAVVDDQEFVTGKTSLEKELNDYRAVFNILTESTQLYEEGAYADAFEKLNQGLAKYPQNNKIEYAIAAYQYTYVLNITGQVVTFADDKDYKSAVALLENAIETYDCQEFQELLHDAKMKSDFLFAAKEYFSDAGDYAFRSAKKLVLGDFAEDEQDTLLSLGGTISASLVGADVPLDIRDLAYDMTHWGAGDYFAARLALDAVGVLPFLGAVKYLKHMDDAKDAVKTGEKVIDAVDTAYDIAKKTDEITDTAKQIDNMIDTAEVISDVKKKTDSVSDLTEDFSYLVKKEDTVKDIIIHYTPIKTINQGLEGQVHGITGIEFIRKNIDLSDGRRVTGVFAKFDPFVEVKLPESYYKASFNEQKKYLIEVLQNMLETTEGKKQLSRFSQEELAEIAEGIIPTGYVWHHNETEGLMQLVEETVHAATAHTGGMSIWGIGY